jgi:hypothetical protein
MGINVDAHVLYFFSYYTKSMVFSAHPTITYSL